MNASVNNLTEAVVFKKLPRLRFVNRDGCTAGGPASVNRGMPEPIHFRGNFKAPRKIEFCSSGLCLHCACVRACVCVCVSFAISRSWLCQPFALIVTHGNCSASSWSFHLFVISVSIYRLDSRMPFSAESYERKSTCNHHPSDMVCNFHLTLSFMGF